MILELLIDYKAKSEVTPGTVIPKKYGDYLIAIHKGWVRHEMGKDFDVSCILCNNLYSMPRTEIRATGPP